MLQRGLVLALLALAAILAAALLTSGLYSTRAPELAARLYPGGGLAQEALLAKQLEALGAAGAQLTAADAAVLLRRAPLSSVAIAVGAQAHLARGAEADAARAFGALTRRSPRNRLGRIFAVETALREERYDDMAAHFDALVELYPEARGELLDWIVAISADARTHGAIGRLVSRNPSWTDAYVIKLVRQASPSRFELDLCARAPKAQSACVRRMVDDGRLDEAFTAWLEFLGPGAPRFSWPYDGAFAGIPGAEPFNWVIDASNVELMTHGGLDAVFLGRKSQTLVWQLLLLGPGAYELEISMKGEERARGGRFRWSVACTNEGGLTRALDIVGLTTRPQKFHLRFEIPDDCPAQRLSLSGIPGELPLWAKSQTLSIGIQSARDEPGLPVVQP